MTGHQPTPESGIRATNGKSTMVTIEEIVSALGIKRFETVDPYDVKRTRKVIEEIMTYNGPTVIISKRPCALLVEKGSTRRVTKECNSCGLCLKVIGCPAIVMTSKGATIDPTLCRGCGVCEVICPLHAIGIVE
jgi:indolepyruvate ferredoxin oxidoreductase alpha subunit